MFARHGNINTALSGTCDVDGSLALMSNALKPTNIDYVSRPAVAYMHAIANMNRALDTRPPSLSHEHGLTHLVSSINRPSTAVSGAVISLTPAWRLYTGHEEVEDGHSRPEWLFRSFMQLAEWCLTGLPFKKEQALADLRQLICMSMQCSP